MLSSFIRISFCAANIANFLYVMNFRWRIGMDLGTLQLDQYKTFKDETSLSYFASEFLTSLSAWNVLLQLFYFCICLLDAIVGSDNKAKGNTQASLLQRFRDFLFSTLALPLSILVTTSFWAIYGINRELIWPLFLGKLYPLWVNHMIHTTCMLSQLIEMSTVFHAFPSTKTGTRSTAGFLLTYLTWILYLAFNKGVWIYPVLEKLPAILRTVFILVYGVYGGVLFVAGKTLNGIIWSRYAENKRSLKYH